MGEIAKPALKKKKSRTKLGKQTIQKTRQKQKKPANKKRIEAAKKQQQPALKHPDREFWQKQQPDLGYNLNSAKSGLYKTGYYNSRAEKRAGQQDFYNPVLNSRGVDELVRAAKIKNEFLIDRYVNPFLLEKFDAWKMLHRIDVQIRYVLEPYSCQRV